jgi:hypothetical protein
MRPLADSGKYPINAVQTKELHMAKYMVLYRSSVPSREMASMSSEDAQAGMALWMQWATNAGTALVDMGAPLAPVDVVGDGAGTGPGVCGFSILEADSTDAVTKLLDGHPHLHSPGNPSIEILEFLPVPGM